MKHQYRAIPGTEGLVECTVCCGAEGELPTECPGRPMSADEKRWVMDGKFDFKDGMWNYTGPGATNE